MLFFAMEKKRNNAADLWSSMFWMVRLKIKMAA